VYNCSRHSAWQSYRLSLAAWRVSPAQWLFLPVGLVCPELPGVFPGGLPSLDSIAGRVSRP